MNRRIVWAPLLLLALTLCWVVAPAGAQWGKLRGGPVPPDAPLSLPGPGRMLASLDLTEDQQAKVEKIRDEVKPARIGLRKDLLRLRNELKGEMLKDNPDAGELRKLAEQMGEIRTKMQISRFEECLAIRKILTPDQRDRLLLMHARKESHMRQCDLRCMRPGACGGPCCGPRGHGHRGIRPGCGGDSYGRGGGQGHGCSHGHGGGQGHGCSHGHGGGQRP
ncbi:MAG: Spy/CpxP family protein refolding chaperone [Candidatus Eisenbacteria sp.]|nr:Spy/CpxP family protein refolding chaperone [Candidatus Eisenbacteria bacterium]